MLAMIDDFEFDVHETSLDDIESKIEYSFATHQNLAGFDTYQNTGKYEEQITLKGTLICKSQKQLDAFEKIGARKQAVTLAFSNGKACDILIFGISKKRNNFLNTGEFLKQDYDIALKVVQPRLIPGGVLI